TDAFLRPVVDTTAGELVMDDLPLEFAVGLAQAHDDALVALDVLVARPVVVRADEDLAAGEDRPAVGLAAEELRPEDVLVVGNVPVGGHVLFDEVDEVALHRAAPDGPVAADVLAVLFLVFLFLDFLLVLLVGVDGEVGAAALAGGDGEHQANDDDAGAERQPTAEGGGGFHDRSCIRSPFSRDAERSATSRSASRRG